MCSFRLRRVTLSAAATLNAKATHFVWYARAHSFSSQQPPGSNGIGEHHMLLRYMHSDTVLPLSRLQGQMHVVGVRI